MPETTRSPLSSPLSVLVLTGLVLLAMARPPAAAGLPSDVTKGAQLYGVVCLRKMPEVLPGFTGGAIDIKEVRQEWVLVDYVGSQKKETWLDFSKVIAYRTKR